MSQKTIIISGIPVAQPRARIFTRNGHVMSWDPAGEAKKIAKAEIAKQTNKIPDVAIEMFVKFFLPVPKSTSKKKKALMLTNEIKHIKRPDTSNYLKFTEDALDSVAFKDDSQLWHVDAVKLYSDEPRTVITIKWEDD